MAQMIRAGTYKLGHGYTRLGSSQKTFYLVYFEKEYGPYERDLPTKTIDDHTAQIWGKSYMLSLKIKLNELIIITTKCAIILYE